MNEKKIKALVDSKSQEIIDMYTSFVGRKCKAQPEYAIANNIQVDYALLDDKTGEVLALIECKKGDDIDPKTGKHKNKLGVHDLMTGIGQVEQYIYQMDNNLFDTTGARRVADGAKAFLATDENVKTGSVEWEKLSYPKGFNLLLFDESSKTHTCYELYKKSVLDKFATKSKNQVRTNAYFSKESCIWECYIALKEFDRQAKMTTHDVKLDRESILKAIFANPRYQGSHKDVRNIAISLRKLNFINDNNQPTRDGLLMIEGSYFDFVKHVTYYKYIDQFTIVLTAMIELASDGGMDIHNIECSKCRQIMIKNKVKSLYAGKDVTYVTNDNATRYIGAWFAMLKDELGVIDEKINAAGRKCYDIRYFPYKELDAIGGIEKYAVVPNQVKNYLGDFLLPGMP